MKESTDVNFMLSYAKSRGEFLLKRTSRRPGLFEDEIEDDYPPLDGSVQGREFKDGVYVVPVRTLVSPSSASF